MRVACRNEGDMVTAILVSELLQVLCSFAPEACCWMIFIWYIAARSYFVHTSWSCRAGYPRSRGRSRRVGLSTDHRGACLWSVSRCVPSAQSLEVAPRTKGLRGTCWVLHSHDHSRLFTFACVAGCGTGPFRLLRHRISGRDVDWIDPAGSPAFILRCRRSCHDTGDWVDQAAGRRLAWRHGAVTAGRDAPERTVLKNELGHSWK
jgi:hypothetical protein